MKSEVGGEAITAKEQPFKAVNEGWNEYQLEGGIRVRVKTAVAKIGRQVDEDGNYKKNQYGDPAVLVRYGVEVVTSVDEPENPNT